MTMKTRRRIEIMTKNFLRPTLMVLAVSTSPVFFAVAHAAEEMDHSKMNHGSMGAMDHSNMGLWTTAR